MRSIDGEVFVEEFTNGVLQPQGKLSILTLLRKRFRRIETGKD